MDEREVTEEQVIANLRKYTSNIHRFNSTTFMQEMERDRVEVWICSGGGCKTNTFVDILNKSYLKTSSQGWLDKGCHAPYPQPSILNPDLRSIRCAIYLYSYQVEFSVASMLRRGQLPVNFFKMRPKEDKRNYTVERFIENLGKQVEHWTNEPVKTHSLNYPVLVVNTDFLNSEGFLEKIHETLSSILQREIPPFNYEEKTRETVTPIQSPSLTQLKEKMQSLPPFKLFFP